jgi:hypothetical protein
VIFGCRLLRGGAKTGKIQAVAAQGGPAMTLDRNRGSHEEDPEKDVLKALQDRIDFYDGLPQLHKWTSEQLRTTQVDGVIETVGALRNLQSVYEEAEKQGMDPILLKLIKSWTTEYAKESHELTVETLRRIRENGLDVIDRVNRTLSGNQEV